MGKEVLQSNCSHGSHEVEYPPCVDLGDPAARRAYLYAVVHLGVKGTPSEPLATEHGCGNCKVGGSRCEAAADLLGRLIGYGVFEAAATQAIRSFKPDF